MSQSDSIYITIILAVFIIYTLRRFEIFDFLKVLFMGTDKKRALKQFFSSHFKYFNQLSDQEKDIFVIRAYKLLQKVRIIGRQDFKVSTDIKLFVIAAYVQLTFGFKFYMLPKFRTILLYPDAYQNKITGKMHYGEVNPKGIVVLSWKTLLKGHKITDDAINLGLHEMAHALMHTIIHSNDHEIGLDRYLRNIVNLSYEEMEKIKSSDNHLFRSYAGTNMYEFFAIAVENFFEKPVEFKKHLPQLYNYLVLLLKQDPVSGKFRFNHNKNIKWW